VLPAGSRTERSNGFLKPLLGCCKPLLWLEKNRSKHPDENAAKISPLVGLKKPLLARSP
jgi:hypothetical protein